MSETIKMRHQNIGQKLNVKPFAKQESRTSLASLVTKEKLKIQHFWGNSVQNTIVEKC